MHAKLYALTGWARATALGISGGTSLLLKAETTGFPGSLKWLADTIVLTKSWAWLLIPAALSIAGLSYALRKKIGDPAVIQVVHELLTAYRNKVVSERGTGLEHHHRVTLFRHKEWAFVARRWPWQGWLIPEIRSGETTRNPSCRFRASSEDPDRAEGVAGLAWVSDRDIEINDLPDVSFPNATNEAVATYARNTGVTPELIRKMRPHARCFYAFRVHLNNKLWGVIVIDSKNNSVPRRKVEAGYEAIVPSLSVLLKRI